MKKPLQSRGKLFTTNESDPPGIQKSEKNAKVMILLEMQAKYINPALYVSFVVVYFIWHSA